MLHIVILLSFYQYIGSCYYISPAVRDDTDTNQNISFYFKEDNGKKHLEIIKRSDQKDGKEYDYYSDFAQKIIESSGDNEYNASIDDDEEEIKVNIKESAIITGKKINRNEGEIFKNYSSFRDNLETYVESRGDNIVEAYDDTEGGSDFYDEDYGSGNTDDDSINLIEKTPIIECKRNPIFNINVDYTTTDSSGNESYTGSPDEKSKSSTIHNVPDFEYGNFALENEKMMIIRRIWNHSQPCTVYESINNNKGFVVVCF